MSELDPNDIPAEWIAFHVPLATLINIEFGQKIQAAQVENFPKDLAGTRNIEHSAGEAADAIKPAARESLADKLRPPLQDIRVAVPAPALQRTIDEKMPRFLPHGLTMTLPLILRFSIMRIASAV